MTLVFLGPPGSGKGTQGKKVATYFHLAYVASGDLVRAAAHRGEVDPANRFYALVRERMLRGRPQPDEVIIEILREHLKTLDLSSGIIFDSFPISLGQAQRFIHLLEEFHLARPWVLYLSINEWESVKRLAVRKFCVKCGSAYGPQHIEHKEGRCSVDGEPLITRSDDRFHVILRRMAEYRDRMTLLRRYYAKKGMLIEVDGKPGIDEVFSTILAELKNHDVKTGD